MLDTGTRQQRRHAYALERRAVKTGDWGPWERVEQPHGISRTGWPSKVRWLHRNELYVVLCRPLETEWGSVVHCAIRTASNLEPPWRDRQRIKNELFGAEAVAVEVMPATSELIDEADMYHIWILPAGFRLPFSIFRQ